MVAQLLAVVLLLKTELAFAADAKDLQLLGLIRRCNPSGLQTEGSGCGEAALWGWGFADDTSYGLACSFEWGLRHQRFPVWVPNPSPIRELSVDCESWGLLLAPSR